MKLEMHPQCVENSIDYKKITMGTVVLGVGLLSCAAAYFTTEEDFESIQAAYTMGAMTISAAVSETTGVGGVAAQTFDTNVLAVSFAF